MTTILSRSAPVVLTAALSLCAVLAWSRGAEAHAHLKSATPAVDATVITSPPDIRILFTEAVEPAFTGLVLTDAAGHPAPTGTGTTDPKDAKMFVVPVTARLQPGVYKVHWHALAVDTHKTEGDFSFTVAP